MVSNCELVLEPKCVNLNLWFFIEFLLKVGWPWCPHAPYKCFICRKHISGHLGPSRHDIGAVRHDTSALRSRRKNRPRWPPIEAVKSVYGVLVSKCKTSECANLKSPSPSVHTHLTTWECTNHFFCILTSVESTESEFCRPVALTSQQNHYHETAIFGICFCLLSGSEIWKQIPNKF